MIVDKKAEAMRGKLLYPRIVRLWVRDILAFSNLAFRVTIILPEIVVISTVLNIVDSWLESLAPRSLNILDFILLKLGIYKANKSVKMKGPHKSYFFNSLVFS